MKKVILILAMGAFIVAGFSSCKKCTTCVVKLNGATFYTYPETCGSAKEIDDFKAAAETTYTSTGGYTIDCTDK
jgi:hypothetical protein